MNISDKIANEMLILTA